MRAKPLPKPTVVVTKVDVVCGQPVTMYSCDGKTWSTNPGDLVVWGTRQITAQREIVLDDNILHDSQENRTKTRDQRARVNQPTRVRGYTTKVVGKRRTKPRSRRKSKATPIMQITQGVYFT